MASPCDRAPPKGIGPFTHTDPHDRPPEMFGGVNALHFGADMSPYLPLPVIPPGSPVLT